MNFEIISTDEHSHCDFGTLLKFDTMENAQQAVDIIVNQPYASNKLADGYSGAFRVDTYVMFNVYDERVYFNLIKELRDAAPAYQPEPAGEIEAVLYGILAYNKPGKETNKRTRRVESRRIDKLAARFITENIPGATYLEHDTYYENPTRWIEAWFDYDGRRFHVDFCLEEGRNWLNLWSTNLSDGNNVDVTVVTPDTIKELLATVDKEGHFVKPEEKIFEILPNATEEVYLSDNNHPEYIEASKAFLNKYLPDATFDCADSNGNGDNAWFNIRFVYDGHKFGLDFTRADSEGGTRSYEIYEIFNDGDYTGEFSVTPETLRETIKKEFFKDEVKKDTEDDTEESPEEPSIETRVTKLENLMDQVQKEIKEIKKKI